MLLFQTSCKSITYHYFVSDHSPQCGQNVEFMNVKPGGTQSEKADCPYLLFI